jgi:hypothetical protein
MINYIVSTTAIERKQRRVVMRPITTSLSPRPPATMLGPITWYMHFHYSFDLASRDSLSFVYYCTISLMSVLLHITLQQRMCSLMLQILQLNYHQPSSHHTL